MQVQLDPTAIPQIPGARIAILQAKWYREHVDNMVKKCEEILAMAGCEKPEHHILPGSLELPLAAQTLIRSGVNQKKPYDAVICFGAIMKGETYHFEMIMDECIRGLGQVMLAENTPIIVEVIPVTKLEQLIARSQNDAFNKGVEAALAAAEIVTWRKKIQTK
jgi:6,7-dimethyl-8-ribityllumazine synthase